MPKNEYQCEITCALDDGPTGRRDEKHFRKHITLSRLYPEDTSIKIGDSWIVKVRGCRVDVDADGNESVLVSCKLWKNFKTEEAYEAGMKKLVSEGWGLS